MRKEKVAIVLGTRPEAIKLIPLYKEFLKCNEYYPRLISTGQHKEMLKEVFDIFEVEPDIELDVMQDNQTLSELSSRLFASVGNFFVMTGIRLFSFRVILQLLLLLQLLVTIIRSRLPTSRLD